MPPIQFGINSYQARALPLSAQNIVNLYAEKAPPDAKSQVVLYETPGIKAFTTAGNGPIRGMHVMAGVLYVVSANMLYSIDALGKSVALGSMAIDAASPSVSTSGPSNAVFEITGGSFSAGVNRIVSITIDGVEILSTDVDWVTSNENVAALVCENIKGVFPNHIYSGATVDVSALTSAAVDFKFKTDGTKLFVADSTAAIIYQYSVDTPWDLSGTVTYDGVSKDISGGTIPIINAIVFSDDGTKMYQAGTVAQTDIIQWTLTTPWVLSTLVESGKTLSPRAGTNAITGLTLKPDGTEIYYHGSEDDLQQHTLATAGELDTASFTGTVALNTVFGSGAAGDPFFRPDGLALYVTNASGSTRELIRGSLRVAWDITTLTSDAVVYDLGPAVGTAGLASLVFKPDGLFFYVLQSTGTDTVHQFFGTAPWTCVSANAVITITAAEDGPQNNGLPVVITTEGDVTVDTPATITAGGFLASGVDTSVGGRPLDHDCVSMANNAATIRQLCIVDGTNGWIYTTTGGLVQITDADFLAADTVTFQDQYFIFNQTGTGNFFLSNLNDGTAYTATDIAAAEGDPDDLVAVISNHREVWLFGETTIEVWFNSGDADFPFDRISGSFIERGCAAAFSIVRIDNTLYWLGEDRIVYRASGYVPERISQSAMEHALEGYAVVSDVCAFVYTMAGHKFYVMNFVAENVTWVYDASTGLWHQRESRNADSVGLGRWRANAYASVYGKHLVGDFQTGQVGEMDHDTFAEYGNTMQGLAVGPPIDNDRKRVFIQKFELDVETGVGLTGGQGSDPQIELAWSDDGGRTFGDLRPWRSMGKIGAYRQRLRWNRQGSSRQRIYKMVVADPVKRSIVAANIDIQAGLS